MRTKKIISAVMVAALVLGALALVGCTGGKKSSDITGEWKMDGSDYTYVFNDTAIVYTGGEIPYTIEKDGVILLGEQKTEAKYELSDDGKTLTIIETFDMGGSEEASGTPQEIKTVFKKISDNKDAKPSSGTSEGNSNSDSGSKENDSKAK